MFHIGLDKYYLRSEVLLLSGLEVTVRRLCMRKMGSTQELDYTSVGWLMADDVSHCLICAREFSKTTYKHHCKACGNVVCSKCSPDRALIIDLKSSGSLMTVCMQCYWGQEMVEVRYVGAEENPNQVIVIISHYSMLAL